MGLFLSMSGIIGASAPNVERAVRNYAQETRCGFQQEDPVSEWAECLIISPGAKGIAILYPANFFDGEKASVFLSRQLEKPVFYFHVHDSDLWMYILFDNGEIVDRFNQVPDYWQTISEEER